jgi:hypothetical protein
LPGIVSAAGVTKVSSKFVECCTLPPDAVKPTV